MSIQRKKFLLVPLEAITQSYTKWKTGRFEVLLFTPVKLRLSSLDCINKQQTVQLHSIVLKTMIRLVSQKDGELQRREQQSD